MSERALRDRETICPKCGGEMSPISFSIDVYPPIHYFWCTNYDYAYQEQQNLETGEMERLEKK